MIQYKVIFAMNFVSEYFMQDNSNNTILRKPAWLKIKLPKGKSFVGVQRIIDDNNLHTICTSGKCPNAAECWGKGTATFMVMGDICTRSCKFCNTKTGKPLALDKTEPVKVARSIALMNLKHAVITSVDRDDLPDLGAGHWVDTIKAVKKHCPETTLEVLIPDFQGKLNLVDVVIQAKPEIISHNIETVRELTPHVRSAAKYDTSLSVLKHIAESGIVSKSGLMLGMGESEAQILTALKDLKSVGVSVVTLGQYLQPSKQHLPVKEYVHPDTFDHWKTVGLELGFRIVESGPLVRSSYHAENHI